MPPQPKPKGFEISPVNVGGIRLCIMGTSPLVFNRVAEKAKRELLLPAGRRRSKADRAGSLKHDPITEYRNSVYRTREPNNPTRLTFPSPGFKSAIATASLDLPGIKKTETGRLVWVPGTHVDIYGIPKIYMAIVRNSDINRTPDVRTRAIVPYWACYLPISFVMPNLTQAALMNLVQAAGITAGIGDGRQEKGKLNFGQFMIVNDNDERFHQIIANGGMEAQDVALEEPEGYDDDTTELLTWFEEELDARLKSGQVSPNNNGPLPPDDEEDEDGEEGVVV